MIGPHPNPSDWPTPKHSLLPQTRGPPNDQFTGIPPASAHLLSPLPNKNVSHNPHRCLISSSQTSSLPFPSSPPFLHPSHSLKPPKSRFSASYPQHGHPRRSRDRHRRLHLPPLPNKEKPEKEIRRRAWKTRSREFQEETATTAAIRESYE